MVLGEVREEVLDEVAHVLAALAERRDVDVDDVEAVEQVLAEGALADALPQVAVGGADHADVDPRHLPVGADRLDLAGLEEAEQQGLHPQRHLADFVEEDGAAVGHLQQARPVAMRVGEAALHVAEQLGFEQASRAGRRS